MDFPPRKKNRHGLRALRDLGRSKVLGQHDGNSRIPRSLIPRSDPRAGTAAVLRSRRPDPRGVSCLRRRNVIFFASFWYKFALNGRERKKKHVARIGQVLRLFKRRGAVVSDLGFTAAVVPSAAVASNLDHLTEDSYAGYRVRDAPARRAQAHDGRAARSAPAAAAARVRTQGASCRGVEIGQT
jgi:hypothetical protein